MLAIGSIIASGAAFYGIGAWTGASRGSKYRGTFLGVILASTVVLLEYVPR